MPVVLNEVKDLFFGNWTKMKQVLRCAQDDKLEFR